MKILEKLLITLSIAFMIWAGASWVDIVSDNSMPNPVHSEYNLFIICFGGNE